MEKLKFEFKMRGSADGKTNILCITSIETPDERKFIVPDEIQPASLHTVIANHEVFGKVKKSITKRNQLRKIWITVTEQIRKDYLDEEENLQFKDYYLEESTIHSNITNESAQTTTLEKLIEKLIETNQKSEKPIEKIAKELTINKFNNKTQNASQWLKEFEEECNRFNVTQDEKKIKLLKLFLDKPCVDWYECVLIKLTINSQWLDWRKKFCDTFANKGWSPIRYAINFKYQTGSLIEYALRKEKLMLETRKDIDVGTLIDLIAVGLPNYVSDKIDRNTLIETEDLYNELGKLEHLTYKKTDIPKKVNEQGQKVKTPCTLCKEKLNKVRFHPVESCWYIDTQEKDKKEKKINNALIDIETEEQDPKNLYTHH